MVEPAVPLGDGDRHDAEGEQRILLGEPDAHYSLRYAVDLGHAELVLDEDHLHRVLRWCRRRRPRRPPRGWRRQRPTAAAILIEDFDLVSIR